MSKSIDDLPPNERQQVARLNQLQQQLEMIMQQRMNMEAQVKELDFAVKELEESGEEAVCYKSIGGLFIKKDQPTLLQDTKERKENLEMKVKSLTNQEDRSKKQFEELRTKVQAMLNDKPAEEE